MSNIRIMISRKMGYFNQKTNPSVSI
ncbi:MAG: hypothetical protein JWO87_837, partial [Phycisphaerales bacterium]|nr:hypothetical protein [Phycisphaerales bacterium]